jgi:CubicO group peptidase (beta-lactamase class C family)
MPNGQWIEGAIMGLVHGTCDAKFTAVRQAFARRLDADELGASIAVDWNGKIVVDLWGGFCDEAQTWPWNRDTIVNVWSTTKTVTALAALTLVERGLLDVHAPVARYWPEFAQNGKDRIEVRHLLSHTSGVSGWDPPITIEDLYDLPTSTARLAAQTPWWEPGTASGYHANSFGHLNGELVRRVTGKSLTRFVAEDLAGPMDADFQIGARESDWHRIAPLVSPPPLPFDFASKDPKSPMVRTNTGPAPDAPHGNTPGWRRAEIGAANGHGNALGIVRVLRAVSLGGTAGGVRLLSPATINLIFEVQADGTDLVLEAPLRFGIGFGLPKPPTFPFIPEGRICFWGGWGGSVAIMDVDRGLTIGYAMNRMAAGVGTSERCIEYVAAVYAALGTA